MIKRCVIACIQLYQRTLSPDHGKLGRFFPFLGCRFYPSCSVYSIHAIERKGLIRGGGKALFRIMRCNPFSQGGVDTVQ